MLAYNRWRAAFPRHMVTMAPLPCLFSALASHMIPTGWGETRPATYIYNVYAQIESCPLQISPNVAQ